MSEAEKKNIDINLDDMPDYANASENETDEKEMDIDMPIDMLNNNRIAKKEKEKDDAKKAQKDKADKEKAEKISKNKAIRKLHKKWAKNYLFMICLISTISSTCVIGFFIWFAARPNEWLFCGIVALIGMIVTLIHTYAYRYIREEIYRK